MRSSSLAMAPTPPLGAKNNSTLFCGVSSFQFGHDAGDQLFGVADGLGDDLDIHGRFAWRAGALAIDAVLAYQHQRVRENIEGNGELTARFPHHEFVLFQLLAALFVYAHRATTLVIQDTFLFQEREDMFELVVQCSLRKTVASARNSDQSSVGPNFRQLPC